MNGTNPLIMGFKGKSRKEAKEGVEERWKRPGREEEEDEEEEVLGSFFFNFNTSFTVNFKGDTKSFLGFSIHFIYTAPAAWVPHWVKPHVCFLA